MNSFLHIASLPAQVSDPYCYSRRAGSKSQVSDVFLLPLDVAPPADPYSLVAWRALEGVRHYSGQGGVEIPTKYSPLLPRLRPSPTSHRSYVLQVELLDVTDENYRLAEFLQAGRADYRIWYATLAGRMIGGRRGILLRHTDADMPLSIEGGGVEKIICLFAWTADGDAPRRDRQQDPTLGSASAVVELWGEDETNLWGEDENSIWAFN